MSDIEEREKPEDVKRFNFYELRQIFQNMGMKVIKGAFQSLNFIIYLSGWRISNDSVEFYTGLFSIGGTTITINNTVDIQDTLNIVSDAGGGTLYLQNGTYVLTADLFIPAGVALVGVSRDGVIIDCDTSFKVNIVGDNAYSTGTVSINNGDDEVVGSGTTFSAGMVGRFILIDGNWYEVTAFTDTTHIDIAPDYAGANLSGSTYVIADVNFQAAIKTVTIINSSTVGLNIQYNQEVTVDNILIYDCGIGLGVYDSVFPLMKATANSNGVNFDAENMWGWEIIFSEFSNSLSGAGIEMLNCGSATFIDSLIKDNTGNGMSLTLCRDIAFVSLAAEDNGGHGVECISGCTDIEFIPFAFRGNTGDGLKLTATCDRIQVVGSTSRSNGGWGINIANANCDDNVINAPSYLSNGSGTLNNSGTGTIILPQVSLAGTKVYYASDSSGGAVTRKLTFFNGILISET